MKIMTCEMCGSSDLVKENGYFVCQTCGTKYSVEEAKKLMIEGTVEVTGNIKVDHSDEAKHAFEVARMNFENGSWQVGYDACERALMLDPNSYDAWDLKFRYLLKHGYRSIEEIANAADNAIRCYPESKGKAFGICVNALKSTKYGEFDGLIRFYLVINNAPTELVKKGVYDILNDYYDKYVQYKVQGYGSMAAYKAQCSHPENELFYKADKLFEKYNITIDPQKEAKYRTTSQSGNAKATGTNYQPNYQQNKQGGCYVATCVYGSYNCPQVWTLRRFRDNTLAATWYGRVFIRLYYAVSPAIVKWFGETVWFKKIWRGKLDRFVKRLNNNGVKNTPYNDKEW